jgi:4-hydroxybenzoate polyprenyltransferase
MSIVQRIPDRAAGRTAGWPKGEFLGSLRLCLIEARPVVAVMFALRYLTAAALAGGVGRTTLVHVLAGAVVWELAVLSTYIVNGTMDVAEDRINRSRRPIASGRLTRASARRVAAASAVSAAVGGLALGGTFCCLVLAFLGVGYLYSAPPLCAKRNAVGCALTGVLLALLTYGAAYAAAGAGSVSRTGMIFCGATALWTGIVGSVTKDIPDAAGDMAAGRRTTAVMLGETGARILACGAAVTIGAAFTVAAVLAAPVLLASAAAMLGGALLVGVVTCPARPGASAMPGRDRGRRPYRAFMVTQYATHLCVIVILIWPALILAR